jgi:CubicO group peptidase (beta-lactamase class C family)
MRRFTSMLAPLAVLALVLVPPAHAQGGDELDEFILNAMEQGHIPGVAAAIVKGDKVVWAKGYGMANLELGTTVSLDTPFFLASISKVATATALMQLRDAGAFALDDNVNDALPFDIVNPFINVSGVSYRQLLTHTASLQDNWEVMEPLYLPGDSAWQLQDFHPQYWVPGGKFYRAVKNYFYWRPGNNYEYCNQAFSLLGLIGQNLSGMPFEELCKQRIFQPLGMTHSSFRLVDFDPATLAMPYSWNAATQQYVAEGHYGYPDWPAGTLRTSILDIARFQRAFINEGTTEGVQLLKASTVEEMLTVQFRAEDPQGLCFYYVFPDNAGRVVGHDGGDPGVLTDMYFRPTDDTGVILLANGDAVFASYWEIYERLWYESNFVNPAWHHLGHGLEGTHGQPYMQGTGDFVGGQELRLELEDALANASASLVIGYDDANTPFHGGVLVPSPDVILRDLTTDSAGNLTVTKPWPVGVPAGTQVYFQFWVTDPAGPQGFAASNAIVGTVP